MAITLVQKNGSASTGTLNVTPPAWGSTTVAGNLLLVVGHETAGTNGTWPTSPSGYTAYASTPFIFSSTAQSVYGLYWKIAAGGDATPGNYGETSSTQNWVTYTYEFNNPSGWINPPNDAEVHSALSNTAAATKASGSTATLAQTQELAIAIMGGAAAVTALSFSNSYVTAQPTTNNGKLWVGWKETSATTAENTTASWTTSTANGVRIATFKANAPSNPILQYARAKRFGTSFA